MDFGPGVDLKQVRFACVHADMGGSYVPDKKTGLCAADLPLNWMLDEVAKVGLKIEPHIKTAKSVMGQDRGGKYSCCYCECNPAC